MVENKKTISKIDKNENNENNQNNDNNDDMLSSDKSLQCLRVEINSHVAVFLYYKRYPKANSTKFPQSNTAIFFYFDHEHVNEKFFYTYISFISQIDTIEIGSFINRKGSKKKRKVVNFAIVKLIDEESLDKLLDRHPTQLKINEFIENKRGKSVSLNYDTGNIEEDEEVEDDVDSDGFVKVTKKANKKRFTGGGASFKVGSANEGDGQGEEEYTGRRKKKNKPQDFYWNFQFVDKKRQSK